METGTQTHAAPAAHSTEAAQASLQGFLSGLLLSTVQHICQPASTLPTRVSVETLSCDSDLSKLWGAQSKKQQGQNGTIIQLSHPGSATGSW